jgi:lipoprotein-releasing system permease protein
LKLSTFIAKRYLISKKSHNAINIISAISVAGICIGTMAMIIVLSAFNGITALVLSFYNSFDPDIRITPVQGKTFVADSSFIDALKRNKEITAYTLTLQEKALLKYNDKQVIATIKGVDENFSRLSSFDTVIVEGSYKLTENNQSYAILGAGIAHRLEISAGGAGFFTPLHIYIPKAGNDAVVNPEDAFYSDIIYPAGIFSLNDDFDSKYVLLPLNFVRKLLLTSNKVSAVEIAVNNKEEAPAIAQALKKQLGTKYVIKTRFQQNEVLFKTLQSEKWWTFLILAFILLIGTFNIIGSITMLIIEKKKDINILVSIGADQQLIRRIFLTEGFCITIIGAVSGLLIGLLICWLQVTYKFVPFNEGFVVDAYPIRVNPLDILYIFSTVMTIGFLAAWYPVRLLTKVN